MCYNEFVSLATLSWGILKAYFHLVDCWNIFLESCCGHHYEKVTEGPKFHSDGCDPSSRRPADVPMERRIVNVNVRNMAGRSSEDRLVDRIDRIALPKHGT